MDSYQIQKKIQNLAFLDWNDYGIEEKEIGRGTYGGVYEYRKNGKRYAIKVSDLFDNDFDLAYATLNEITITITLHHPNIINILDVIPIKINYGEYPSNRKVGMVMPIANYSLKILC